MVVIMTVVVEVVVVLGYSVALTVASLGKEGKIPVETAKCKKNETINCLGVSGNEVQTRCFCPVSSV